MYFIYVLTETSHEWIDWVRFEITDNLNSAREIGKNCGFKYWGIRLSTDKTPSYICEDDRWIK